MQMCEFDYEYPIIYGIIGIAFCCLICIVYLFCSLASRQPDVKPFDGWHLYFDSREYLHPRLKLPRAACGVIMDLRFVFFPYKFGHFLNARQLQKLRKVPVFSSYIKNYGLEKIVYGVFKYNSFFMGSNLGSMCEFVILDTRQALDVLSDKHYVQIFLRCSGTKYTEKTSFEILFPITDLEANRFLLYYYRYNWSTSINNSRSSILCLPSIEYALNDFYCLPCVKKLADTFITRLGKNDPVKIFITGGNGCGKTTFVNLLLKNMKINYTWATGIHVFYFRLFFKFNSFSLI